MSVAEVGVALATRDQKSFKGGHCAHSEKIIKPIERDRKIITVDRMKHKVMVTG